MPNKFYKILEDMLHTIEASKPHKQIMTVDELVKYTGFSKSYIYKLTSQRLLPHYKPLGKALFFKRAEIDAWITDSPIPATNEVFERALINLSNYNSKGKSKRK